MRDQAFSRSQAGRQCTADEACAFIRELGIGVARGDLAVPYRAPTPHWPPAERPTPKCMDHTLSHAADISLAKTVLWTWASRYATGAVIRPVGHQSWRHARAV